MALSLKRESLKRDELWTVRALLESATGVLRGRGVSDARLDAGLLLAHVLGCDRLRLYMEIDRPVDDAERAAFRELVKARARRVPVAYLTGRKAFYGLELSVSPAVLIPRPETEALCDLARDAVRAAPGAATVADVGTGSGAIALALAHDETLRLGALYAIDQSAEALAVARENAKRLGLSGRIRFLQGDLLAPILGGPGPGSAPAPGPGPGPGALDLVVSNPPYVATTDRSSLAPELHHEPEAALFAGADGLECVRRLLVQAARALRPGGQLLCEIGHDQGERVAALAREAGLEAVEVLPDLSGTPRILSARRPASSGA